MKFKDIPQFPHQPTYHVNFSLVDAEQWVSRYVSQGLQLQPDFQRAHVWTESQQIAYIEYLLQGGASGLAIYMNQYLFQRGERASEKYPFVLVDGLQRITAARKFVNNELPVFGLTISQFEDKLSPFEPKFDIYINDLKTKIDVLRWYKGLNSGGTAHTPEELARVDALIQIELDKSKKG